MAFRPYCGISEMGPSYSYCWNRDFEVPNFCACKVLTIHCIIIRFCIKCPCNSKNGRKRTVLLWATVWTVCLPSTGTALPTIAQVKNLIASKEVVETAAPSVSKEAPPITTSMTFLGVREALWLRL